MKHRLALPDAIRRCLQQLDARFPPGSLGSLASRAQLSEYWRWASPEAPDEQRDVAALPRYEALQALPQAAVAKRTMGTTDPYTTIRGLDARVAVAIDARGTYVKLDSPLPNAEAKRCRNEGLLRLFKPRGYSHWCQARVGDGLRVDVAVELLRAGLQFEFEAG